MQLKLQFNGFPFKLLCIPMNRRAFLRVSLTVAAASRIGAVQARESEESTADWLPRWEKRILDEERGRACDHEMGEELGWLVSPLLNGFYYGYLATGDEKWIERLLDWADAVLRRAVMEPDGFSGWPKGDGGGGNAVGYDADSLLGEAMFLRPVVLMAAEILKQPKLKAKWGEKAQAHLKFASRVLEKWNMRDCWREVEGGGLWVVPAFGIDRATGKWTDGYAARKTTGFSNPANKQNHISRWFIAMHNVIGDASAGERAGKWWALMRRRMRTEQGSKYFVWNYWDPAGPWDLKPDGEPRHWVGVHPNGGYYGIDLEGIVTAFQHHLVFTKADIDRLIATNRDYMWNQKVEGARFGRIDGGAPDPRWKDSPGVLWTALLPYDAALRRIFVANHDPASWGGIAATPWYLAEGSRITS